MRWRLTGHIPSPSAIYETAIALVGWSVLLGATLAAHARVLTTPGLAFLLLALALKREGFRVAQLVTHSLAGVAVLGALLVLGPLPGAWVGSLTGSLFLAARFPIAARSQLPRRWRLAAFGGGLNALVVLGCARLYGALGGAWAPTALGWHDLLRLAAVSLAWFLGDHLGWSLRITLEEGATGLRRFLRSIGFYSVVVELLPLPLAALLAVTYSALGTVACGLLALFLVAAGDVMRRLNRTLNRARQQVADLTTLNAFSRALLAARLDGLELCRLLQSHTAAVVDARYFWLGLYDARRKRLEPVLIADGDPGLSAGDPSLGPALLEWAEKRPAALLIRDAQREALPFDLGAADSSFRSAMLVPLVASGELIGLLAVRSPLPSAYSDDDLRTVVTFANQTAMAIQNARSYQAEQRRARQIATVGEVSRRVVAILGMEQLFAEVVSLIREAFSYYHVQLFTVTVDGRVEFRASTCQEVQAGGLRVGRGEGLIGWVAESGQPVVVNDVMAEPRYRPSEGLEGIRSEVVVPLKVDERLVGILDLQSDQPDAFSDDDLSVLRTLADQVAIAIEDDRLYRAEKARRQLADTLREVAAALSSTLELPAVLDLVLSQLQRVIRYDSAAILEWDGRHYCIVASLGPHYGQGDLCLTQEEDARLQRLTVEPKPFTYSEAGAEEGPFALAAPLQVRERLIGALILEREGSQGRYTEDDSQVVAAFANQAAVAIENARLYAAQQEEAWVSTALLQVAETLANLTGIDEVLDAVTRLVPLLVGVDRSLIFLRDEDTGHCRGVRAYGMSASEREALLAQRLEEIAPTIWQALQESPAPLVLGPTAPAFEREARTALGITRGLALPLRAGGETLGALLAGYEQAAGPPNRNRRAILTGIANQAAMAIQNAYLYIAQREEAWMSTALLQVSELAGRSRDPDEILAALARLTPMLVGVDHCLILLWDRARQAYLPSQAYGLGRELRGRFQSWRLAPGDFPLLDRVREGGKPLAAEGPDAADLLPPALAGALGLGAVLALPLDLQAELQGIVLVGYAERGRHFTQRRVALLTGLANQAAMALENVRLYRQSLERERIAQELRVARQIQATFLPEACPALPGWSIAATSRPAREVGGDFYDFIRLGPRRLGLVIADVSDKGVPAALFMALSRNVMRAVAVEGRSPAATLRRVNDLLLADSRSGMFVTLFYAILDTESGELVGASAGHNPLYWYCSRRGELKRLAYRGVALGVIHKPPFEEGRIDVEPGDALVLYTDGVTESCDASEHEFGEEMLEAAILAQGPRAAEPLMAAINQAVQAFVQGAPQQDDYTLIVISRDGFAWP